LQINKIKNDKQIKNNAIRDKEGNFFALQDGRAKWDKRKSYSVNFAKVMYMLGSEELKNAEDMGVLKINKETGEVFDTPEARKYFLKHIRMTECSMRLGFKIDTQNAVRLFNAHFCRDRLCAICMWRLSRRLAWETSLIIDRYMAENPDMIPILIGLTVKNPKMGELSDMLDVLCHGKSGAWQILQKWLARRGIKDYIRTVEITLNSKEKSWHPHIHCLAFVPKEYFKKGNKNYISLKLSKKNGREFVI
jgi:plasmid rolling circle replication initiator protein Rep